MTARKEFENGFNATLRELRNAGLLREMQTPRGLDLVSNDYLGLADHPRVTEAMRKALAHLPSGSGGSRLLRGHLDVFDRIEARLALFSGTESALLFGSGYAANIGLLGAIVRDEDVIFSDAHNHASLIDGTRLTKARIAVFPHQDLEALERALKAPRSGRAIVVTESVFSMDGDVTPLGDMLEIADRHDAVVVVDEAHATGMFGMRGSGVVEAEGLRDRVLATIHTAGKALGSGGAWVAGSRALRDVLVNRARSFIFSTAPLPVLAAAIDAGLDVLANEPERPREVHRKSALLRRALAEQDLHVPAGSFIVPIIAGTNDAALALQSALRMAGFDARAIRPPSVAPGTSRLRVTVRYPVSDSDLERFAQEVGRVIARTGLKPCATDVGAKPCTTDVGAKPCTTDVGAEPCATDAGLAPTGSGGTAL